jgi:hypothetical protein
MCYEYSGWFWKARVKQLDEVREQPKKGVTPEVPAKAPERPREDVKLPEQIPA